MTTQFVQLPELTSLKPATIKAVDAWYAKTLRMNEVDQLGVDIVGERFVSDQIQWQCERSYVQFTLGQLVSMLDNLSSICQFEIDKAKVEKLINGTDAGIFRATKNHPLYMPPEILCVVGSQGKDDEYVIGGGRHRIVALATVLKNKFNGWEELLITCSLARFRKREALLEYITHSNGSRNMTPTEKSQIKLGMSFTSHTPDEFFAAALVDNRNLAEAKELTAYGCAYGLTELRHLRSNKPIKLNTAVELMKSFISKFSTKVNAQLQAAIQQKKTLNKLMVEPCTDPTGADSTYLKQICEVAVSDLVANWETYFELCRREDKKGNVSYLLAHSIGEISNALAEKLALQFGERLVAAYQTYEQQSAEEKAAKDQAKEAKKEASKKTGAVETIKMLVSRSANVDQDSLSMMVQNIARAAKISAADLPVEYAHLLS